MKYKISLFYVILCFVLSFPVQATESLGKISHGIAMHGMPKYGANFKALDYVNIDAPKGGRIRHGVKGSFNNLNHHIITGTNAKGLELINDKLMVRVWDEPFSVYGLVAESIEMPDDRSWIVFNLNPKAKFHDGVAMTTDDVEFSYEMYKKYGHPVRRRVYGLVEKVTKLSKQKIRFDFGEGYDAETALILAMMPVLPQHYWESKNLNKTTVNPPLGSGPYRIKSVDMGRKISYERVKDYWAKDLPVQVGQYNFDEVDYIYYRDDGIALEAFKSGDFDIRREWDVSKWKTHYDFPDVEHGIVKKEKLSHQRPEQVKSLIFNTRNPLFENIETRQALSYAFDFEWMNKNLFQSAFKRIDSFFPNSELAARSTPKGEELEILNKYIAYLPENILTADAVIPVKTNGSGPQGMRQNLRMATRLLKKSGWHISPKTKQLVYKDTGKKFEFEILLNTPNDEKIVLEYARSLKKLGIIANVRTVDSAQFTGRLDQFDFDMVLFRWINSLSPGNEQMNYWGKKAANQNGSRNYAGVQNTAIDEIADSIARSPTRKSLVARTHALDRVLRAQYYAIPLFYLGHDFVAYHNKISRPENTPLYGMVVETWWQNDGKTKKNKEK